MLCSVKKKKRQTLLCPRGTISKMHYHVNKAKCRTACRVSFPRKCCYAQNISGRTQKLPETASPWRGTRQDKRRGAGEKLSLPLLYSLLFPFFRLEYSLDFKELCILNKAVTLCQASSPTWVGLAPTGKPCHPQDAPKPPHALGQSHSWGPLA